MGAPVLPPTVLAFPLTVFMQSVGGCGAFPPPIPVDLLWAVGADFGQLFSANLSDASGTVQVFTGGLGAPWQWSFSRGAMLISGPMIWVPAAGIWQASHVFMCGVGAHLDVSIFWDPTAFCSVGVMRAPVDEEVSAGSEVLRWNNDLVMLDGAVRVETARTTAIWAGAAGRGTIRREGSSALPRAGGQRLRYVWP